MADGTGFDPAKVPSGPAGELFRSGKDGSGLSDAEYDIMKQRFIDAGESLPWETADNQKEEQ